MAHTVVMPRLGNTVEACVLNAWFVELGQRVDAATLLCEVETDKSSVSVPAGVEGIVLALLATEGDEVPVLEPIAVIGEAGEEVDPAFMAALGGSADAAVPSAPEAPAAAPPVPAQDLLGARESAGEPAPAAGPVGAISPRARSLARSERLPETAVSGGTGPHGRVIARDVLAAVSAGPGLTRAAQASSEVHRYQPGVTAGSALGGRVSAADLAAVSSITAPRRDDAEYTDTPIRGVRKIIAERMVQSHLTTAQVSYQVTAPAAALLALRARLKAADPALGLSTVTIGDLVAFAAARVAVRHPAINAHVVDGVLRSYPIVHMGLAVDTPRGLMVPTVNDASSASLKAFSTITKALAAQCQDGSISPDLLTGATFTVTNLGSFGIEGFTPIVNVPQTSILGVGAILPRPIAGPDGSIGLEDRISFSLTADHRVVDGAEAARFLQEFTAAITHIDLTALS